jgi:hypothetical protein
VLTTASAVRCAAPGPLPGLPRRRGRGGEGAPRLI